MLVVGASLSVGRPDEGGVVMALIGRRLIPEDRAHDARCIIWHRAAVDTCFGRKGVLLLVERDLAAVFLQDASSAAYAGYRSNIVPATTKSSVVRREDYVF